MGARKGVAAIFVALSTTAAGVACGSGEVGSGTVVTRTPQVGAFERLEVGSAFDVTVTLGDAPAVVVRADDNFADRLDVGVTDGTLHIGLTEGTEAAQATLEADVTAVSLSEIGASGDASIHLADELTGEELSVTMSGASHLDASVALDHGTLELSGASVATLTGSAQDLSASGSGASRLALQGLSVSALDVTLSGASSAQVTAEDELSYDLSGASSLQYAGSPTLTHQSITGGSSVNEGGG
jgi:hypothetical protein